MKAGRDLRAILRLSSSFAASCRDMGEIVVGELSGIPDYADLLSCLPVKTFSKEGDGPLLPFGRGIQHLFNRLPKSFAVVLGKRALERRVKSLRACGAIWVSGLTGLPRHCVSCDKLLILNKRDVPLLNDPMHRTLGGLLPLRIEVELAVTEGHDVTGLCV